MRNDAFTGVVARPRTARPAVAAWGFRGPTSHGVGSGATPRLNDDDMSNLARYVRRGAGIPDGPIHGSD